MEEKQNVWVVFEERPISCDTDYECDGCIIVWDSEELCKNPTTIKLIDEVRKLDEDLADKTIKNLVDNCCLDYETDKDLIDSNYFDEVYEFLVSEIGGGVFYKYDYQIAHVVFAIYDSEEKAKEKTNYFNNNISYNNKYHYSRYDLQ